MATNYNNGVSGLPPTADRSKYVAALRKKYEDYQNASPQTDEKKLTFAEWLKQQNHRVPPPGRYTRPGFGASLKNQMPNEPQLPPGAGRIAPPSRYNPDPGFHRRGRGAVPLPVYGLHPGRGHQKPAGTGGSSETSTPYTGSKSLGGYGEAASVNTRPVGGAAKAASGGRQHQGFAERKTKHDRGLLNGGGGGDKRRKLHLKLAQSKGFKGELRALRHIIRQERRHPSHGLHAGRAHFKHNRHAGPGGRGGRGGNR